MLSNDANILKIKHEILYQVAKLAYAGQLEEKKEELPYELLPGPQAKYRCCVYKEREVVRQRIRLAEGKCPSETPKTGKDNVVQVIEAACADCPLSHYIVTDNCRYAWLDTGTMDSLFEAGEFVRTVQRAQGLPIAVAEEIAFENGWIDREQLMKAAEKYGKSPYGKHLKDVADNKIIVKSKHD